MLQVQEGLQPSIVIWETKSSACVGSVFYLVQGRQNCFIRCVSLTWKHLGVTPHPCTGIRENFSSKKGFLSKLLFSIVARCLKPNTAICTSKCKVLNVLNLSYLDIQILCLHANICVYDKYRKRTQRKKYISRVNSWNCKKTGKVI